MVHPNNAAPRWWDCDSETELAGLVCGICDGLEHQDEFRRARWRRALSLYEGRNVSLDDDAFFVGTAMSPNQLPPVYNLTRSACDSAQADIAGRQKPKPMFLTTGADWKARRRAKKLDKFVEAQLCESQGSYADAWQLLLDCFHDSAKGGDGIAKVWGDTEHRKVRIERVLPWELHVDQREARYGDPQNIFHGYDIERDIAVAMFCEVEGDDEGNERRKMAIESAKPSRSTSQRVVQSIKIREAWRLPFSKKKPGRHVIAVEGAVLFDEEWTRGRFPFVKLVWNRETVGYWGVGIAEEGESQQELVNDIEERLAERMRICSTRVTYFNPNTAKRQDLEQSGGEGEVFIPVDDMSQSPNTPPVAPASQAEFEWLEQNKAAYFEIRGISQMSATSQKPSGVNAAVAMQTLNDIQTVRFLPKARGYETAFETLGQLMVDAARDIADCCGEGGYLVKWPGKRFLATINWKEVSLEEDMYQIRVAPVSQYSRDPAAILEMAQDLFSSQVITKETFLQMVGLPDLEDMLNRETAESEFIRELMDRYLDCTTQDELDEAGGWEEPEPFLSNPTAAVALCISTYWEAKKDRAPEFCLKQIRNFIQALQPPPPPAPPQQAAPPMPAPMPGPGAPPMGAPPMGGPPQTMQPPMAA